MKVAALQHDIHWDDRTSNFGRLTGMIRAASSAGADLVVLPADFATGTNRSTPQAESHDGPSIRFLRETAQASGVVLCSSLVVSDDGSGPRAHTVLTQPDGTVHTAAASCNTSIDLTDDQPLMVRVKETRVTVVAGAELDSPLTFWRVAEQTDVFVIPAAASERRTSHFGTLATARAIESRCFVVAANRVGAGGGLNYNGGSRIVDPAGDTLTQAWGAETSLFAQADPALVRFTRERNPLVSERRSPMTLG